MAAQDQGFTDPNAQQQQQSATPALKAGWTDAGFGNGMVKNAAGQLFYQTDPEYMNSGASGGGMGTQSNGGTGTAPQPNYGGQTVQQPNDSWGAPGVQGGPAGGDYKGALMQQLFSRANQSMSMDPNTNPVMKQQMDAFNAQQDRSTQQQLDANAEQAAARGLGNSGALDTQNRMAREQAGFNSAGFQGQLMQNELNNRRQEVANALQSMQGILSEDEKNALTKEMHDLDASIEQTKTSNQNSQYYAGLSSNERIAANRLAEEWALGQQGMDIDWAKLAQGDQQWADKMGFDTADRQQYWDSVRRGQI